MRRGVDCPGLEESEDVGSNERWVERGRVGKLRKSAKKGQELSKGSGTCTLEGHQIFQQARVPSTLQTDTSELWRPRIASNLIAYDGISRLFVWDSEHKQLHFVEIQSPNSLDERNSDRRTLLSSKEYQTVQLSSPVDFEVLHLAFNRTGRSLALTGYGSLMVLSFFAPSSTASSGLCRIQKVGADHIFSHGDGLWLRILQIGWHPYSDTHLGVLSSDGCFRLFDLSLDIVSAEQEYYLQPRSSLQTSSAALGRAIAFVYGGEHLWDRFTIFILYGDGSLFALCPIVPFGSMFNGVAIDELAKDARQLELPVDYPHAIAGSLSFALTWLDAVFPGLASFSNSTSKEVLATSYLLQAHAYIPLDASVALQGPLATLCRSTGERLSLLKEAKSAPGQAVTLLYNVVGKDSVLVVCTKYGQLQIFVLADEVQPSWNLGKPAQLTVDDKGHILAAGMLVEASDTGTPVALSTDELEGSYSSVWPGKVPPLLQLAVVDLALQAPVADTGPMVMFVDPVVPERFYCQHAAGLDAVFLQWLPFSQNTNKTLSDPAAPVVSSILDICSTGGTTPPSLLGVALILDSFGESWVVAVTANCECAVVNMKLHRTLLEPIVLDAESEEVQNSGALDVGVFQTMSKELLLGPKDIPIIQVAQSASPLTLETIQGRTFLHDQCKLLHEKYVEYAHRVHVELTSHGSRLHDIVEEQHGLLKQAEDRIRMSRNKLNVLVNRVEQALLKNGSLETRVKQCHRLPGVLEKQLTHSEKGLKCQLDTMRLQDLDFLNSAVEVLSVRALRFSGALKQGSQKSSPYRVSIPDSQIRRVKHAVEHLGIILEESSLKVKVIDESVSQQELLRSR